MRVLVALKTDKYLKQLKDLNVTDVIISDYKYSSCNYCLSFEQIKEMNEKIHQNGLKSVIRLDRLYDQKEIKPLKETLKMYQNINIDTVLFSDIALKEIIEENNFNFKMIYAPETLLTNHYDVQILQENKVDSVVISKDIPFSNMLDIASKVKDYCFLRIFGEVLISYSKRRFINMYLADNQQHLEGYYLREENRDFKMPVVEKDSGFWMYGYSLCSFEKLEEIFSSDLKGVIIDEVLESDDYTYQVVKLHHQLLNKEISIQQAIQQLEQLDDSIRYMQISEVKQTVLEKENESRVIGTGR